MADNLPSCTAAIIHLKNKVIDFIDEETTDDHSHKIKQHVNSKFEKDVSEAIGFHDGNNDIADVNSTVGMLGLV